MTPRNDAYNFLKASLDTDEFTLEAIPSDASFRVYYRVKTQSSLRASKASAAIHSYILMDSSKELSSLKPFISITKLLHDFFLRAPQIIASDIENGFLLLEDFGNNKINLILNKDNEEYIYKKIIDVLIELHKNVEREPATKRHCEPIEDRRGNLRSIHIKTSRDHHAPQSVARDDVLGKVDFIDYSIEELNAYTDWYIPYSGKTITAQKKATFLASFKEALESLKPLDEVLILADFHVDNLILLDDGEIGLLDYQDAVIGSPAYDLVSLLQDVRRKIDFDFAEKMIDYYVQKTGIDSEIFRSHYHAYGIQRNLRILGFFARKQMRDNNPNYLKYIPLLKEYIEHSLNKSSCFKIENFLF